MNIFENYEIEEIEQENDFLIDLVEGIKQKLILERKKIKNIELFTDSGNWVLWIISTRGNFDYGLSKSSFNKEDLEEVKFLLRKFFI